MSTILIESDQEVSMALQLIRSAIENEITRLELALETAQKRLTPFERKYNATSEQFMATMAAEDLEGGDDEYVQWAGEYILMQRLQEKLQHLQEIKCSDFSLLHSNQSNH